MNRQSLWLFGCLTLLAVTPLVRASDPARALAPRDVPDVAALIDRHIAAGWTAANVQPASPADDAEFLRRVCLDLAGRIPSVAEARSFLKDPTPDKRQKRVDLLLESPRYVTHWVNVWRALLLPETNANIQIRFFAQGFETWLREQLTNNAGYNEMVRELLTTPIDRGNNPQAQSTTAIAYYQAKEASPENLAAGTARVFLGVRLECAQCHDHPFASWKREQFWGLAAFFAGIQRQNQGDVSVPTREVPDRRELTIPGTDRVVQAGFPDGTEPVWRFQVSSRKTLADWMTSANNPYFARAGVNRVWFHFFGRGLVDPVDDMVGGDSTASHPELLDELAREFAAHDFDLKFLIRAITASRAYQLTSAGSPLTPNPSPQRGEGGNTDNPLPAGERGRGEGQADPRLFAKMPLRGLTPEQLFDSLSQATGYQEAGPQNPRAFIIGNQGSPRDELLTRFANQSDKPTEYQTSILQALSLMNGRLVAEQTSLENSATLAGILDAPFLDTAGQIETLYLATLTRKPKPKEIERLLPFVEKSDGENRKHALADVFWALLNSSEFFLNH